MFLRRADPFSSTSQHCKTAPLTGRLMTRLRSPERSTADDERLNTSNGVKNCRKRKGAISLGPAGFKAWNGSGRSVKYRQKCVQAPGRVFASDLVVGSTQSEADDDIDSDEIIRGRPEPSGYLPNEPKHLYELRKGQPLETLPDISLDIDSYDIADLSITSLNMDIYNLASVEPEKAQDAVEIMLELKDPLPNAATFTIVMDGYIQLQKLSAAQAVFDRMEELGKNDTSLAPSDYTYMLLAQAWANDFKEDFSGTSGEKAVDILRRMQNSSLVKESAGSVVKVFSIVVDGWCKRSGIARGAMKRARDLLDEMEIAKDSLVKPNVLTYTSYIGGLARCKESDMAAQAEKILDRMREHGVDPDMVTYTAVINCWAKAVSRRERSVAAARVLRLLSDMERMYIKEKNYGVKPSLITYSAAIAAIGNSLDPIAPQLAEDIILRMEKLSSSGAIANLKPNTSIYNAVLYALSRAPSKNRLRYAQRAESLLEEMTERAQRGEKDLEPDVRTWAAVLRAWSRSKRTDAAENAQRVLSKMEERYEKGFFRVRPNYVCYTTVMGAWGNSQSEGALDKMEPLLQKMEKGYEETQQADWRPNTVSYIVCIDAYIRRNIPDAAQRAQATVDRMMKLYSKGLGHVRPTRPIFNALIHAWSRSNTIGAAQKAEKIFTWMEQQSKAGDDLVRPDAASFCAVLNAWANQAEHGGAERAEKIWEHIKSFSSEDRGFRPTIAMPNIVIKAIARSKDPKSVQKAEGILLGLEEEFRSGKSDLHPDVTTYSSVINACAYCNGGLDMQREALETALRTFQKLCALEDETPSSGFRNVAFGTLFKAIQKLMPVSDEREKLVQRLFDQCCDDGYVDHFVLTQVRYASPKLFRDLVVGPCGLGGKGYGIETVLENIPEAWSENVTS